jgi:protein SDA1
MNADLLGDLILYKHYKDRSVMMAAQSLIGTFRRIMPDMLRKKDRGRPTEANIIIKAPKYGEVQANDFVSGAEVLADQQANNSQENDSDTDKDVSEDYNYYYLTYYSYIYFLNRMMMNGST